MNDPHVESLHYLVIHGDTVNYDRAELLEFETTTFRLQVAGKNVTVWPKGHFADEGNARTTIEPFLRRWEFDSAVRSGADEFTLTFEHASVVDRSPTPGALAAQARPVNWNFNLSAARGVVGRARYPKRPSGPLTDPNDPDAQSMLQRLEGHRSDKEPLGQMAYFCVTVLEIAAGFAAGNAGASASQQRTLAAKYYSISKTMITSVAKLSTEKGGATARKANGTTLEYTADEKAFLLHAVQAFILRAAEKAGNPTAILPKITKNDLPYRP